MLSVPLHPQQHCQSHSDHHLCQAVAVHRRRVQPIKHGSAQLQRRPRQTLRRGVKHQGFCVVASQHVRYLVRNNKSQHGLVAADRIQ